jgi:serine/threonine-protein kinase
MRRLVAVKVLRQTGLDAESRERFLREGQYAGRISHKNVVHLFDLRVKDGSPFLILELVRGVSVMDRLREGVVSIFEALEVAQHVAAALGALADQGVVHRDVKPSNILLSPDGVAKISDFGIAKDLNATSQLTQAGVGLGTFSFMAPEQFQEAKDVDHSADMYGLGATLYHMIAGRPPFLYTSGVNPVALVKEILESSPPRLREFRPDCPLEIADFVHRLISKEPRERPQPANFVEAMLAKLRKQHCAKDTQRMLWESSSDTSTGD